MKAIICLLLTFSFIYATEYYFTADNKGWEKDTQMGAAQVYYNIGTLSGHYHTAALGAIVSLQGLLKDNPAPFVDIYPLGVFKDREIGKMTITHTVNVVTLRNAGFFRRDYKGYNTAKGLMTTVRTTYLGRMKTCKIYINEDIDWDWYSWYDDTPNDSKYCFLPCMTHELGHSLGLGHTESRCTSIMNEDYRYMCQIGGWKEEDQMGVSCIYGNGYQEAINQTKFNTYSGGVVLSAKNTAKIKAMWARCDANSNSNCSCKAKATFKAELRWNYKTFGGNWQYDILKTYNDGDWYEDNLFEVKAPGAAVVGYFSLYDPDNKKEIAHSRPYYIFQISPRVPRVGPVKPDKEVFFIQDKDNLNLYIPAKGQVKVFLYNLLGQIRAQQKAYGNGSRVYLSFSKKHLKPGSYFFLIKTDKEVTSKQVLVTK